MNFRKEQMVKNSCFKSATLIYCKTMKPGCPINYENAATQVYSIGLELYRNGKDRYWKTHGYNKEYTKVPCFLKRVYIWLRETFWEKRVEKSSD